MTGIDEAREIVRATTPETRIVMRGIETLQAHVLAEDIVAREDIPLFDSTAMDGYAVRSEDLARANERTPLILPIRGELQPGDMPSERLGRGEALRILTGAAIPPGADAVIMQEHVVRRNDEIVCSRAVRPGSHIRRKGEEFAAGNRVLQRGTPLTPAVVGLLAALGYPRIRTHTHPRITVLVTGNELRRPGDHLAPGEIRDVNSYTVSGILQRMGFAAELLRVRDERTNVEGAVREALRRCDVLITTGGVSVGDHDHVRGAMREAGVREHFWRVAMKPGKPVFFGTRGRRMAFGLPGNPLSVLLGMYLFVRPALAAAIGAPPPIVRRMRARLGCVLRKEPGREHVLFMRLDDSSPASPARLPTAFPMDGQGSHMLGAAARSDLIYRFPAAAKQLREGSIVELEHVRWELW